jgi:hypothetical protein
MDIDVHGFGNTVVRAKACPAVHALPLLRATNEYVQRVKN